MSLSHHTVPHGLCALACLAFLSPPAEASDTHTISNRNDFVALVAGAHLSALGVTMQIDGDGRIRGEMLGTGLSGRWHWQDDLFCRELSWGDRRSKEECQTVTLISQTLRFTSDAGQGQSKDFWLRR